METLNIKNSFQVADRNKKLIWDGFQVEDQDFFCKPVPSQTREVYVYQVAILVETWTNICVTQMWYQPQTPELLYPSPMYSTRLFSGALFSSMHVEKRGDSGQLFSKCLTWHWFLLRKGTFLEILITGYQGMFVSVEGHRYLKWLDVWTDSLNNLYFSTTKCYSALNSQGH